MRHDVIALLEMTTYDTATHIVKVLNELGIDPNFGWCDKRNDLMYLYAPNDYQHSTMLVAHIDTVDNHYSKPPVVGQAGQVLYSDTHGRVLGADDRAGVYAILEILKERHRLGKTLPPVLFTNLEEGGGIGVGYFCKHEDIRGKGINLMLELDRQGKDEYVEYHQNDPAVRQYVQSFGFHEEWGCYSDIADLTGEYEIPSVNLSIGYQRQHTAKETLNLDWMDLTISRVHNMLDKPIDKCYPVEEQSYNMFGGNWIDKYEWRPPIKIKQEDLWDWDDADKADSILKTITCNDHCWLCGNMWWSCKCGTVCEDIKHNMTIPQIEYLMDSLLDEEDVVYKELECTNEV